MLVLVVSHHLSALNTHEGAETAGVGLGVLVSPHVPVQRGAVCGLVVTVLTAEKHTESTAIDGIIVQQHYIAHNILWGYSSF